MPTFTRRNAWNQNGTFQNTDLLWYAKAVEVMQSRSLDDLTSWWFYAAIHGSKWPNIPAPPNVPSSPLPPPSVQQQYWDQCQHGTWFFPPWHRGYLYGVENILREIIVSLDGPDDWALPYWNYFGPGDEYKIPPAFTDQTLPDGTTPNPLFVTARYGPNNDGNIFIPLSSWGITEDCQKNPDYTGDQPNHYGGDVTGFEHSGYDDRGSLEDNPHNFVHVAIGGQNPASGTGGLMSVPNTAGLDPVFYLHHCNIDRMWAEWNASGKSNPTDPDWINGPTASGNREFYMPNPDKTAWKFTPGMVNNTSQLNYTYDNLSPAAATAGLTRKALRLRNFGLPTNEIKRLSDMALNPNSELVGANSTSLTLDASGARTTVKLDTKGWNAVTESINKTFLAADAAETRTLNNLPDEVYLLLEGVKGKEDSIICSVSVNHQYAGHFSLFGLRNATIEDGHHAGAGLTIKLDITKVIDQLQLGNDFNASSLDVLIQPVNTVAQGNELTIDRVSVYRKGQI